MNAVCFESVTVNETVAVVVELARPPDTGQVG